MRRQKMSNRRKDGKIFSATADASHKLNSNKSARPMRGGIRL